MNLISPNTESKLTEKQAAFVKALVTNGGNKTQAAITAGYSPKTAREQAYDLIKIPHVMHAILEATLTNFIANAPKAQATLKSLLEAKSEYVRLEAAKDLLDRAGLKPVDKHSHSITGDISINIDLS
jgi:phage terminase small subunit